MKHLLRSVRFIHYWGKPWQECDMCFFGLGVVRQADDFIVTIGLMFYEFGIRISAPPAIGCVCGFCGKIQKVILEDSLPTGWEERKFEEGSKYACPDCLDEPICRVCGCTNEDACLTTEGTCHWVEPDLCSVCANIKGGNYGEEKRNPAE